MFCTYCNATRPHNEAACPNCGAPSPLLSKAPANRWGNTGPQSAAWGTGSAQAHEQWNSQAPQAPFSATGSQVIWGQFSPSSIDEAPQMPFSPPPTTTNTWGQSSVQNNQATQQPFNTPPSGNAWGQFSPALDKQPPQVPFSASPAANPWGQFSSTTASGQLGSESPVQQSSSAWGTGPTNTSQNLQEPPKSLVPVPYQPQTALQVQQQQNMALPVIHSAEHLLPALPEDAVYMPPMYTKPRPIIPRYRIISGILSLLIVSLLICGGATYYANANGTLKAMKRAITGAVPTSIPATSIPQLPDPPTQAKADLGPAYNNIPAATTTSRIDKNNTPLQPTRAFKVNQTFYLTFTVPNPDNGVVTAKWYMNNNYYRTTTAAPITKTTGMVNGWMSMAYATPAEGSVELYWNGKMAQRLYFVVRP